MHLFLCHFISKTKLFLLCSSYFIFLSVHQDSDDFMDWILYIMCVCVCVCVCDTV